MRPPSADVNPREENASVDRQASHYAPLHTYDLPKGTDRQYSQQFADMYFTRLALLRGDVEQIAEEAWQDFVVSRGNPSCA